MSEPTEYQRPDTFKIRHDLIIPEAQGAEPFLTEKRIARAVCLGVHMLSAIHLDDQCAFEAREIGDVWAYRNLPTEAEAFKLPTTEDAPEPAFRERGCVSVLVA